MTPSLKLAFELNFVALALWAMLAGGLMAMIVQDFRHTRKLSKHLRKTLRKRGL